MATGIMFWHASAMATMSPTHSTMYNMTWASKTVAIMYHTNIVAGKML